MTSLLADLSLAFARGLGLPDQQWQAITNCFSESQASFELREDLKKLQPQIASLALEAGHYQLAIFLRPDSDFELAKAYIFSGQKNRLAKIYEHLNLTKQTVQLALIQMLCLRTEGKSKDGLQLYEREVAGRLDKLTTLELAEVQTQLASLHFHSGQIEQALHHYKQAFYIYENLNQIGKVAISCFNIAICYSHLNAKLELNSYLFKTTEILQSYHLETLRKSVWLFEIETLRDQAKWAVTIQKCQQLLSLSDLNMVQKVVALQSLAKALTELGRINEGEIECLKARNEINTHQLYQFEFLQLALELDLETLVHRKVARTKLNFSSHANLRSTAYVLYKESQFRKAVSIQDLEKAHRIFKEILNLSADLEKKYQIADDLNVIEYAQVTNPVQSARGLEAQLLMAFISKNKIALRNLQSHLQTLVLGPDKDSIWKQVLHHLALAFSSALQDEKPLAIRNFLSASKLAEQHGLERLNTLSLGFLFSLDSHYQLQWIERVSILEAPERAYFEHLFTKAIGRNIFESRFRVSNDTIEAAVEGQPTQSSDTDLLIDESNCSAVWKNETIPFQGRSILFKILLKIAESRQMGLTKEDLIHEVWNFEYDPAVHDNLIYTNINRLRDLIPIDLFDGRYRLSSRLSWSLLTKPRPSFQKEENLSERQRNIMAAAAQNPNGLSRSEVVQRLKISERTALRELTYLVQIGSLQRAGSGRSAHYKKNEMKTKLYGEAL